MESGTLILIAASLGSGGILTYLAQEVFDWAKGRKREEADAWTQRDREAKARRILEEYAHALRRHLIRLSEDPDDWPRY